MKRDHMEHLALRFVIQGLHEKSLTDHFVSRFNVQVLHEKKHKA